MSFLFIPQKCSFYDDAGILLKYDGDVANIMAFVAGHFIISTGELHTMVACLCCDIFDCIIFTIIKMQLFGTFKI